MLDFAGLMQETGFLKKLITGKMLDRKNAFSLLELVIAMTIIGILVASFTVGRNINDGAKLRALLGQYERYSSAINSFYDKYQKYPGDFKAAYDYWPEACGTSEFCNGDGDEKIEAYKESHLLWFHLVQSGFIGGNFSGAGDGDDNTQTAAVNVPKGQLFPVQLSVVYYEGTELPTYQHYMIMGAAKAADIGYGAALQPNDAYSIDEKLDDANPGQGRVFGRNGFAADAYDNSSCLIDLDGAHVANNAANVASALYNNDIDNVECFLAIKL